MKKRFGKQSPRHKFFLNPYRDVRFSRCPICEHKTLQRKIPLAVHVDPLNPVMLNKHCRYCPDCDLLIVHQDELEKWLVLTFEEHAPELIGNDYLVIGTFDKSTWRQREKSPMTTSNMLDHLHDFEAVQKFEPARPVWMLSEGALPKTEISKPASETTRARAPRSKSSRRRRRKKR